MSVTNAYEGEGELVGREDVLGRSAWAAISIMRAALLDVLEELKRLAAKVGARVKRRANMVAVFEGACCCSR